MVAPAGHRPAARRHRLLGAGAGSVTGPPGDGGRPVRFNEPMSDYDVARIRSRFPALTGPDAAAHFDGPGGSQTPEEVGRAIVATITSPLANRGSVTLAERNAERAVTGARQAMADLLGCEPGEVVFGRSATDLTFHLSRTLAKDWQPGDEIVVSRLDHDSNVRPWVIAAETCGVTVRWADFDVATGELAAEVIAGLVGERTRLVAVTAASNLIGTMPDLPAIAEVVHGAGALLYVDGVHYAAHHLVDVAALGADLFVCSPYKFLGPHLGVLFGRADLLESLRPDKLRPSPDRVPERFELGTLPYEQLAGVTASVDFLADLVPGAGDRRARLAASFDALDDHELRLRGRIEEGLAALPAVTLWSRAVNRTPTLLVTFDGVDAIEVRQRLAERGVNAPAGSFYAWETSHLLGLGATGGLRIGLAPYNDDADVDRLLDGLRAVLA